MPKARRTSRPKRFALYWCTTADGEEDWFVVADSARSARRFHEGVEDYQTGEAHAERVVGLPAELQTPEGWRDGPEGKVYPHSSWPSDELLVACGGEIARRSKGKHANAVKVAIAQAGEVLEVRRVDDASARHC